jgi:hypothetical protein
MACRPPTHLLIAAVIIVVGGYIFLHGSSREGFGFPEKCPNLLIKKGNAIYLYKTHKGNIPGVNPVRFDNLEDYVEFLNWERSQGITCPALLLEHTYTTQNERGFKVLTDLSHLNASLPLPKKSDKKPTLLQDGVRSRSGTYNRNMYPFYDPLDQRVGANTPLDHMPFSTPGSKTVDAMKKRWGGTAYTQAAVRSGEFKGDDVYMLVNQD